MSIHVAKDAQFAPSVCIHLKSSVYNSVRRKNMALRILNGGDLPPDHTHVIAVVIPMSRLHTTMTKLSAKTYQEYYKISNSKYYKFANSREEKV